MSSIAVAVLTYAHPEWLEGLLSTMKHSGWPDCPVRVFCDGPAFIHVAENTHARYEALCDRYEVPLRTLPKWGCIQANAQQAFEHTPEDWVICIQDDNLVPPGFFENVFGMIREWEDHPSKPGMFQPPFWHVTDLSADLGDIAFPVVFMLRRWFLNYPDRLAAVGRNPGWKAKTESGEPCVYINAHGSCMIVRRKVWEMAGGFSPHTWRFDEELSGRCWFYTPYSIFHFDGPPLVHGCPGEVGTRPQPWHTYSTHQNFMKATGKTPEQWGLLGREAMELAGGDGCPISQATGREKGLLQ